MSAHPQTARLTVGKKLTDGSKTDCYVVGTTDEHEYVEIEWVCITDSAAAVSSASIHVTLPDGVEYNLRTSYPLAAGTTFYFPGLRLYRAGKVSVTGANNQHVVVCYVPLTSTGAQAQKG